tara:strand:+ start:2551 stop:3246 length:696 start_codon:yes stop_codon:yes gene_type:complete
LTVGKIVIVEDEPNLLEAVSYNLRMEGFEVLTASDGELALDVVRENNPDLVILDVMLPKLDGFELCKIIRKENDVPILMLTAKGDEIDRIVGLEIGADDYVLKPFSMRELMARVRVLFRRHRATKIHEIVDEIDSVCEGNLVVNLKAHTVQLDGTNISLKPKEYDLLALLLTNPGRAYTRDQILDEIWGPNHFGDKRTVDVHIRGLRKKIELDSQSPKHIITIRGVGYRFQ